MYVHKAPAPTNQLHITVFLSLHHTHTHCQPAGRQIMTDNVVVT